LSDEEYYDENDLTSFPNPCPTNFDELKIVDSQKRKKNGEYGKKLCLNGYYYTIADQKLLKITWRCEKYKSQACKCRLTTKTNYIKDVEYHPHNNEQFHSHPPVPEAEVCFEMKSEIKHMAAKSKDNPREILRNAKAALNQECVPYLGNDPNLKAIINRVRSVQPDYGNAPQSIEEIDIPDQLKQTINGHDFVLHDSGKEDSSRFIIFATQFNLELLSQHDTWFADGTFYIAPLIFQQIFSINVCVSGYNIPLLYVCLVS
jgi:hypothetical protein